MNILLVDDERLARTLMADGLRSHGIDVTEAEDGSDALNLWESGTFDIVVTDIVMPGVNGIELARELRERGAAENQQRPVRLFALTGNAGVRVEGIRLTDFFEQILSKPISVKAVADRLLDTPASPDQAFKSNS